MKRYFLFISALLAATLPVAAQQPLYIVNGVETEQIASIPPDDIENVEMLPADEETIARYGDKAANGVMLVTLRYDQSAVFTADSTFSGYIARQVKWGDDEPAARIVLRYTVTPEGDTWLRNSNRPTAVSNAACSKPSPKRPAGRRPAKTARPSRAKASCTSSFPKAS